MIVPSRALLVLGCVWLLPAAAICGAPGASAWYGALALGALAGLALADALLSIGRLAAVDGELPALVRTVARRTLPLRLRLSAPGRKLWLRAALETEPELALEPAVLAAAVEQTSELEFCLRARARGRFKVLALWLETRSQLGLWTLRERRAVACSVHVHPDWHHERTRLASLLDYRNLPGEQRFLPLGKGHEFDRLREYVAGDPVEHVHWKATARRGRPITKLFQVERAQQVLIAIDCSRLGLRRVRGPEGESEPLLDRFVQSALALCGAAECLGDVFGLVTFDSEVRRYLRAASGQKQLGACREALLDVRPSELCSDYAALFAFLKQTLRKRALVFVLTSVDDAFVAEQLACGATLLGRCHLPVVVTPGSKAVAPVLSSAVHSREQAYEHLAGHFVWRLQRELSHALERSRGALLSPALAELAPRMVQHYLRVKRRQLL